MIVTCKLLFCDKIDETTTAAVYTVWDDTTTAGGTGAITDSWDYTTTPLVFTD